MIRLAGLGLVLLALGIGAGPLLSRSAWSHRLPKVAAFAWAGALGGAIAAAAGVVAVVSTGHHGLGHRAAEWVVNCWHHHEGGDTRWYAVNAVLLGAALVAVYVAARRYRRTLLRRRRHHEALQFVVRASSELDDVCVLDHPIPVAYCVPARTRPIVVSSGALDRLDDGELQAVLTHERAHLRHRHHVLLTVVDALAAALAWLPTFRAARRHLPLLLEMTADEIAAHRCGPRNVAMALRKLAVSPSPAGGLAAGGRDHSQLEQRLARLASPPADHARVRRLTWITATASVAVPLLICAAWISATPLLC
ncbi:M56 family metallopeptidase [Actinoallomurus acaciae]|uniref:M56 family metallopeptidase n=1 Tax=Actinoallomurus acaciae TaxID=502577 RepID=A0ABV5YNJ5_9ACTN